MMWYEFTHNFVWATFITFSNFLIIYFLLSFNLLLFRSTKRNACFYLKNPKLWGVQLLDPRRLLHFLLFSFLSFPKLTPASCHATCEFYLKKSDACEILDFSDITRLRKLRPGFSTRFPIATVGHQWEYCFSAFPFSFAFSCNTPADTLRPAPTMAASRRWSDFFIKV